MTIIRDTKSCTVIAGPDIALVVGPEVPMLHYETQRGDLEKGANITSEGVERQPHRYTFVRYGFSFDAETYAAFYGRDGLDD